MWKRLSGNLVRLAVTALGAGTALPGGVATGPVAPAVLVERDVTGVPHVTAGDYRGLGSGLGHAFAEDDPCPLAERIVTLEGSRSRWFGPDTLSTDTERNGGSPVTNLASDVYYRWVDASGVIERTLRLPPPLGPTRAARELVAGYVAGYNAALTDEGGIARNDSACRGRPWVRPLTEMDVWRRAYQLALMGGSGGFVAAVSGAQPPNDAAAAPPAGPTGGTPPSADRDRDPLGAGTPAVTGVPTGTGLRLLAGVGAGLGAGMGSNALAVGRSASASGAPMLLANPHFAWSGADRYYQMRLTLPGRLDVRGASLEGVPMVVMDYNDRLAWAHTNSAGTRFSLYRLRLAPGDPTAYVVDGKTLRMTRTVVRVPVTGSRNRTAFLTRTVYATVWGPVVQLPGLLDWSATSAYALADPNAGNLRVLDAFLGEAGATDLDALRRSHDRTQGLPFLTTAATDVDGRVYFDDAAVLGHLTDAQADSCLASADDRALFAATGIAMLDGSAARCRLGTDPDAVVPGIFGPAELPHLVRADWVANSNGTAWLANPAAPIVGRPRLAGPAPGPQSLRTRLGADLVSRRLAGTDGLGGPGFTLETLTAAALSDRVYSAELARDDLVSYCRTHPRLTATNGTTVDVTAGCAALASWDLRADVGSRGEVLWREFWTRVQQAPGGPWVVPFDPARPLATPTGLAVDRTAASLADAVQALAAAGLPPDAATGDVQRYAGIGLPGCPSAEGCYNVIEPVPVLTPGGYPDITAGTCFLMAVELTDHGPRARTLLVTGQSSDPTSAHRLDQMLLFARKQWTVRD